MDEIIKLSLVGGGGGVGGLILAYVISLLFKDREKKRDDAEKKIEEAKDSELKSLGHKLDKLSEQVGQIHMDSKLASERFVGVQATMQEFRARMDGMSASYGKSIDEIKVALTRMEMDFKRLEADMKRLEATLNTVLTDLKKREE